MHLPFAGAAGIIALGKGQGMVVRAQGPAPPRPRVGGDLAGFVPRKVVDDAIPAVGRRRQVGVSPADRL